LLLSSSEAVINNRHAFSHSLAIAGTAKRFLASRADPCAGGPQGSLSLKNLQNLSTEFPTTHTDFMPPPASGTSRTIQNRIHPVDVVVTFSF
jgi:hypothetical protein